MKDLTIRIEVDSNLYKKNPHSSVLGRKIITHSIHMIHEIGLESFTFKKLGERISSPESSVYRYFENKHMLMVYLTSWYWSWMECRLVFATTNIPDAKERLIRAIEMLTEPVVVDNSVSFVDERILSEIIFSESIKTYHTKNVDEENRRGYFRTYKNVVDRVSAIIHEISPDYQYPHTLVTTIIEGAHQQKYFAEHIPALTELTSDKKVLSKFYCQLAFRALTDTT